MNTKKLYTAPSIEVVELETVNVIAASIGDPTPGKDPFQSASHAETTPSTASFDLWNDTEVAE
jgi:hypothetical protein